MGIISCLLTNSKEYKFIYDIFTIDPIIIFCGFLACNKNNYVLSIISFINPLKYIFELGITNEF